MKFKWLSIAVALVAIATVVSGCGSDDVTTNSNNNMSMMDGNQVDAMFVTGMVPHHQAAIDMAELGITNADHAEIKQLSQNIIKSQQAEIEQMNAMKSDLPETKGTMMSQDEMAGMMSDVDSLKKAKNFDKAFIDAMIPHHQAAVVMANRVIASGSNAEVEQLAKAIVKAQSKEIAEMQSWRVEWYGKPLPNAQSSTMGSMHDGH
ncbi:MAG: DUF305 domain-containing protein [Thermoleophilaceae bacterium]|nr:DUF305 domain-containing protein [Thermoleophilaceae bacterium]